MPSSISSIEINTFSSTNNVFDCINSSGFYWISKKFKEITSMNYLCDPGSAIKDGVEVSKGVNGWVLDQYINGLELRLQALEYCKWILHDYIPPKNSISITFVWRRNSKMEKIKKDQKRSKR